MDIQIKRDTFLQALYLAQNIADRKASMPILANVLLQANVEGILSVASTDLSLSSFTQVACTTKKEGGITVSAKHLHDLVRSLPGDEVHLRKLDNHHIEVKAAKVVYKLVALDEKDFPKLPDPSKVSFAVVAVQPLQDLISKTFFSISTDEARYHLNGVLVETDPAQPGKMRFVSTDGHRLSKAEIDAQTALQIQPGVLVPRRGIAEMRRILEQAGQQAELGIWMGHLFLKTGETVLSIKLHDAQFPPYAQVIPKEHQRVAVVSAAGLLDALRRAILMASDRTFGVRLAFTKEGVRVEADNPDLGQIREEMGGTLSGADITIGLNARYFVDVLQEIAADRVQIQLQGELDPVVIRPCLDADEVDPAYLAVIMPMRL